jgi:hypothetical protein
MELRKYLDKVGDWQLLENDPLYMELVYYLFLYVRGGGPPLWSSGESRWLHNGDVLYFL